MNKRHFEQEAKAQGFLSIAGVDEAGRGPLAGPLVVAACILREHSLPGIEDSKKLTPTQREKLYEEIQKAAVAFSIITLAVSLIDELNILQATMLGMQQAIAKLSPAPDFVLVDGNRAPSFAIPAKAIIQGDALSETIGAASILAKVTRDRLMCDLDREYPHYGFAIHKGYPTSKHIEALMKFGPSPMHRLSYAPVKKALAAAGL